MESLEEVIRCLQAMSQNMNNQNRAVLPPWQQERINDAGRLQVTTTPDEASLKETAKRLDIEKQYGNYDNAKYFCFVPNQNQNQKFTVYVIDRNRDIIAKLEQLQLAITTNAIPFDKAFIIPIQ